jgi:hypothetical protein
MIKKQHRINKKRFMLPLDLLHHHRHRLHLFSLHHHRPILEFKKELSNKILINQTTHFYRQSYCSSLFYMS